MRIYETMHRHGGHQRWWPADSPFEVMVGAILTQNTSWSNVEKAILNLKRAKVLTPQKLNQAPPKKLLEWLRPSGFFNIKAKRLKSFLAYFKNRYRFSLGRMKKIELSQLRQELLRVKGIGPETADSILLYALGRPVFVIDAYTRRVFSRHGLIQPDLPYEEIRKWFEANLPSSKELFNDYHAQIVRVGKYFCRKTPDCSKCPLEYLFHEK